MTIQLNSKQETLVNFQIERGNFKSSDEVLTVALNLLEKFQDEYAEWIEETRKKVESAMTQMERGEGIDGATYINELLQRFEKAKEEAY
ncbi:MAG: type II toxin-antitoxin system ParD family antitoxin [Cyanobacteria bacterium P01_G01_bin.54]